jgi:hypothetical protein
MTFNRVSIRCQSRGFLPATHLGRIETQQEAGSVLGELFLKLVNELLAFRFGGEETALQPSFDIPPSFIIFNLLRPVVSFDFHLILNLPE